MAVRESRRPGEKWFELMERTTHSSALMHAYGSPRQCCRLNGIDEQASNRAHTISDSIRKEQL